MKSTPIMFITFALVAIAAACAPAAATPTSVPATQAPAPSATIVPSASSAAIPEIVVDGADFSFTAPAAISAGWVRVKFVNNGLEQHHAQFFRLNAGVTMEQFQEAFKKGLESALSLVERVGGAGAINGKLTDQVILNLPTGNYIIVCLVPSPSDGVQHLAKGMIKPLTVTPAANASANEPTAAITIHMKDFSFEMPTLFSAGRAVLKIVNDGAQGHEWNLVRVAEGKSAEEVIRFLEKPAGPPSFTAVGGINGMAKNLSGYVEIDFTPGNYLAICRVPDPESGKPHITLGMTTPFIVK